MKLKLNQIGNIFLSSFPKLNFSKIRFSNLDYIRWKHNLVMYKYRISIKQAYPCNEFLIQKEKSVVYRISSNKRPPTLI